MSTQATTRPVAVDELKRAWHAANAGDFRTGAGTGAGTRARRAHQPKKARPRPRVRERGRRLRCPVRRLSARRI